MKLNLTQQGSLPAFLDGVAGELERRVTRSTAFAGAEVLYDEARRLAPIYDGPPHKLESGGYTIPGLLRDAIYHAYADKLSGDGAQVYRVSWNETKAPHGRLIEHGHWRVNKVYFKDGQWWGTSERLATPVWVPPQSFIRRAEDAAGRALDAMKARSVQRFNELIADIHSNGPLLDEL